MRRESITKLKFLIAAIAAIQSLPCLCSAGVSSRPNFYKRLQLTLERDYSRGLDASAIQPILSMRVTTSEDIAKMIPAEALRDSAGQGSVGTKIAQRSLSSLMNSAELKRTSLGRTANQMQQSVETEVAVASREPNSIQHSFKFAMRPTQTSALMTYQGLTNAQVSYQASGEKFDVEVRENVAMIDTDLVYNHVNVPGDQQDRLSLRWAW